MGQMHRGGYGGGAIQSVCEYNRQIAETNLPDFLSGCEMMDLFSIQPDHDLTANQPNGLRFGAFCPNDLLKP